MNNDKLKNIFAVGETAAVEFKRCSNRAKGFSIRSG